MYIVILAGGSGTRFWPLSRKSRPKQLISITGGSSMLQRTVERVLPLNPKRVIVITNRLQAEESSQQLERYRGEARIDIIAEPLGRNTAPAVALAAKLVAAEENSGIMAVLPADHYIRDEAALRNSLQTAARAAAAGRLLTLGILPTTPETGYGYMEREQGEPLADGSFRVKRFVEKPDLATAIGYLESGRYFWNSGMFVWRADTILAELGRYMPEMLSVFNQLKLEGDRYGSGLPEQIDSIYRQINSESIDYGVMERSELVQMIPADIGWSDLGSWSALPEVLQPDQSGTVAVNCAGHININSRNCIISGNGGVVATIGVNDLIVVSTGDALLVCKKGEAQDVKQVVEMLQQKGLREYLT